MSAALRALGNTSAELVQSIQDLQTVTAGITAHAGGTQAAGVPLTAKTNIVSVCATGGDSVVLPLAALGLNDIVVRNNGAASLQVYGAGTDTINLVATATGVAVGIGKTASFHCGKAAPAGDWAMILSA